MSEKRIELIIRRVEYITRCTPPTTELTTSVLPASGDDDCDCGARPLRAPVPFSAVFVFVESFAPVPNPLTLTPDGIGGPEVDD